MSIHLLAVGRPGRLLAEPVAEYEARAARYWPLKVIEVRQEKGTKRGEIERVKTIETARLRERIAPDARLVVLTREGIRWSSRELVEFLEQSTASGPRSVAFVIGGAAGLADDLLSDADVRLAVSSFTLPHDLARLVFAEQLYRAGTIVRGEPYHKGADW